MRLLVRSLLANVARSFVEGGSLHNVMKKFGLFPEALLLMYIRQVLAGLQYLHSEGVIHRYTSSDVRWLFS